jgi:hypothetical protein
MGLRHRLQAERLAHADAQAPLSAATPRVLVLEQISHQSQGLLHHLVYKALKLQTFQQDQRLRNDWRSQGDSNPCFRRERATSWTARRWEPALAAAEAVLYIGGSRPTQVRRAA